MAIVLSSHPRIPVIDPWYIGEAGWGLVVRLWIGLHTSPSRPKNPSRNYPCASKLIYHSMVGTSHLIAPKPTIAEFFTY